MKNANKSVEWRITNLCWLIFQRVLPTKLYLSFRYRLLFGRWINWSRPMAFTEKLQWLKVYCYGEKEACLVDKVSVKEFVKDRIGKDYVLPTLGVWSSVREITFDTLPGEYVLKCNHDSGSIVFVKNDVTVNNRALKQLEKTLNSNYYWSGRETPYKFVESKIFAEPLIKTSQEGGLRDYKFFCFNGEPKIFKIDFNRFVDHHANYYDVNGDLLPFGEIDPSPAYEKELLIPDNFAEMLDVARKLSCGLPFARVDLYNVEGKIVFGEITLFPTSGFGRFTDDEWDLRLGSWIDLPRSNN